MHDSQQTSLRVSALKVKTLVSIFRGYVNLAKLLRLKKPEILHYESRGRFKMSNGLNICINLCSIFSLYKKSMWGFKLPEVYPVLRILTTGVSFMIQISERYLLRA